MLNRLLALILAWSIVLIPAHATATGTYQKGGGVVTVAAGSLPTSGSASVIYRVTGQTDANDCDNTPSGSAVAYCGWNGSGYGPIGSGGATGLTNPLGVNLDLGTNDVINVGTVDGRDVSVDGAKLDGIESGATADQSPAEILAAFESESGRDVSVDGAKLDAMDVYLVEEYPGANIFEKLMAAKAAADAAGQRMAIFEIGRGLFDVDTVGVNVCPAGPGAVTGGVIRGQGGNTGTGAATPLGGTTIRAVSGFGSTNVDKSGGTYSIVVDQTPAGETLPRDTITCTACDFRAEGIRRGDLIELSGWANTANNHGRPSLTAGRPPLKVYRAEAQRLWLESERTTNPALVAVAGTTTGEVRRLKPMIKTCGSTWWVEGITLDANNIADTTVGHYPDNAPYRECSAADTPYASAGFNGGAGPGIDCTGEGTATSTAALVSIGGGLKNVWGYNPLYACWTITAPEIGGQSDHYVIGEGSHCWGGLDSVWYDGLQAQPGVVIRDSQLEAFKRSGIRLSSGSAILDDATVISNDADCIADAYGTSAHAWVSYENVIGLRLQGKTNIEARCGKGIHVVDGGATNAQRRVLDLSGGWIQANDPDVTELVSAPNACLDIHLSGTEFIDNAGPAGGPSTVTFGNSNQSTCRSTITGRPIFSDRGAVGYEPELVVNDGMPETIYSDEYDQVLILDDPATACADYTGMFEALHDGTIAAGQYRYRVVFNLVGANKLVPETHFYDDGGNWPYKSCFIHHPAKAGTFIGSFPDSIGRVTNGAALAVNTANSSNAVIDYEGQIEIDETGLTEDAVLFDFGNHYLAGCTDDTGSDDRCDTSWYGTLGGVIKPQGMVQVSITSGNDSGWTGQGIPSMSKTERLSDVTETSVAIVGAAGASYVDMSDWTIRVRGMDHDDFAYHSPSGWGTTPPNIILSQGLNDGYGAVLYGAQNWSEPARHWSLKNLDHALLFGDPVNGGAQVFYQNCDALDGGGGTAAGTCGDASGVAWNGATYGVAIDALMAEGPTWSSIVAARLGDRNSIKNAYLEAGSSFTGYSIALGSYFCDGATGTDPKLPKGSIVKEPGDCAAGGSGAALAAPLGTDSTARLVIEANNYPAGQAAGGRAMLLGPRCTSSYDVELGGPADIDDNPDGSEFVISNAIASSGGCEVIALTNFASAPQAYYGLKRPHEAVGSVATDPIFDALGDLVAGIADNTGVRIPIGSSGQALTVSGGFPTWAANPGGLASGAIAALTPKATPVGGDHLLIENSEASNIKARTTIASLESALEAVIDLQDLQGALTGGTGGKITDESITAADLAPDSVSSSEIAADAVGSSEIAANAVGSSELADNAVDTAAIQDDAVTPAKVDSTGDFVFGSVAITDPGSGDRVWESPPNGTAEGLGTPASGNCRIGLVGASVAAAVPYFHCDGGSLTLIGGGGSGDITAVGPGFASGAAFTDGVASTGTTMLVWEGTTVDANEFSLVAPSADPGADIVVTFPSTTGTLLIGGGALGTPSSGDASNLTSLNATQLTSGTIPAARVGADHVDALSEIAQGIKTAANDTDPLAVFTGSAPAGTPECVQMNSSGQLSVTGTACGSASGMASFTVTGGAGSTPQTITDGNTLTLLGSTGVQTIAFATDSVLLALDYAATLAANPTFQAEQCVFTTDGTGGGGFLCEGSTGANANEQLHLFPPLDGADTTDFIALGNQPVTFAGLTAARTYTLPDAAATLARTDAAQTFTGTQTFGSSTPILLGTSGSTVGSIGFRNATSGTITVQPVTGALGTITQQLPPAAGINQVNNFASTASSAGTLTLNASSQSVQRITGTTTHTVQMPAVTATGMALGRQWTIANDSTGLVTVNSSGGNAIAVLATGRRATFIQNATTGTDATVWTVVGTRWSGTTTLNPGAISATTCATAITATATGLATTDVITWTPSTDITTVNGYNPASNPGIQIVPYPTANTVNFKLCNPTAGSITPGSIDVNWAVSR